jgi:hypothetical protein
MSNPNEITALISRGDERRMTRAKFIQHAARGIQVYFWMLMCEDEETTEGSAVNPSGCDFFDICPDYIDPKAWHYAVALAGNLQGANYDRVPDDFNGTVYEWIFEQCEGAFNRAGKSLDHADWVHSIVLHSAECGVHWADSVHPEDDDLITVPETVGNADMTLEMDYDEDGEVVGL